LEGMKVVTKKCLAKNLRDEWLNHINNLNPKVVELHRKCFSVSCGRGDWNRIKTILENNNGYAIEDMLKYKAARIAFLYDSDIESRDYDWSLSFAYNNERKYRSLSRTLMNLPNGIRPSDLTDLRYIMLPEPAVSKLKLTAYLCTVSSMLFNYPFSDRDQERIDWLLNIIKKSTDNDIKNALKFMWHYFPSEKTGDFRRNQIINNTLKMIFDYMGARGNWDILGLAKRSEQYHHDVEMMERVQEEERRIRYAEQEAEYAERMKKLMESKTALPEIPLPENENIKFLESYNAVVEEGKTMKHCIAQYAEQAVRGNSYLFHVDYKGEMASVEVKPNGFVAQSYGPKDSENEASKYGAQVLGSWAKKLKEIGVPV
jgi:hypothetical protein